MSYTNTTFVKDVLVSDGHHGIEARANIVAGTVIGVYDGKIFPYAIAGNRVSGGNDIHQTTEGEPLCGIDFINHSCKPNVAARDRIVLYAIRDIAAGEALVMDYREWDFIPEGIRCWCKEPNCLI
jgi:SET domain